MRIFILIGPTIISRLPMLEIFCWNYVRLSSLQLKGPTIRLNYSVKNWIWNHPQQSQRFGFSLCFNTSLLANNILERGWIMCLSFEWLLWQAALFLNFLSKHLGVNLKGKITSCKGIIFFNVIRYGKFSEGSHSLQKKKLTDINSWG